MLTLIFLIPILFILTYPLVEIHRKRNPGMQAPAVSKPQKPVSVILVVYNEARDIERKIREILAEPIWTEGSELLVISGGSTDTTNALILSFLPDPRIKPHLFAENISKVESINFAVGISQNELLLFSDCRQLMRPGSMCALLQKLEAETLDVVVSTLHNLDDQPKSVRNLLNRMNLAKAINANSMNVYGGLYAQRKSAFVTIPENILFDDLYALAATLAQGKQIRQSEIAVIEDVNFLDYYREERIQRLTRGLLLMLFRHPQLLQGMQVRDRYHFLMSKYAKLTIPLLLIFLLVNLLTDSLRHFTVTNFNLWLLLLIAFGGIVNSNLRLFLRVSWFTLKAEFLYFAQKKRSVRWAKFTNY